MSSGGGSASVVCSGATVRKFQNAFTIVELLIVVVVIAILATITILGFNGVSDQAKETALKADLKTAATQVGVTKQETGAYPSSDSDIKRSDKTTLTYTGSTNAFCLQATLADLPGRVYHITQEGTLEAGECPIVLPSGPMQNLTASQCAAMPVYTGANSGAVATLTDARGGSIRSYEVAKLADNRCWMINDLKFGSTTGTTILTPADSNVASNYTLPQVVTTGTPSYNNPGAYGPVTGDTGAGATKYGYMYNWLAATAGASRASNPAGSGDASSSICPAGWRLPGAGTTGSDFDNLDRAFGGTGAVANAGQVNIQQWQATGPFKGVFSGRWYSAFGTQGSNGYLWSRTAHPTGANGAVTVESNATSVNPASTADMNNRMYAYAVRCILNEP